MDANFRADNDSAFRYSAINGRSEVIRFLIERGNNFIDYNWPVIEFSTANGHLEVVKILAEENFPIRVYVIIIPRSYMQLYATN